MKELAGTCCPWLAAGGCTTPSSHLSLATQQAEAVCLWVCEPRHLSPVAQPQRPLQGHHCTPAPQSLRPSPWPPFLGTPQLPGLLYFRSPHFLEHHSLEGSRSQEFLLTPFPKGCSVGVWASCPSSTPSPRAGAWQPLWEAGAWLLASLLAGLSTGLRACLRRWRPLSTGLTGGAVGDQLPSSPEGRSPGAQGRDSCSVPQLVFCREDDRHPKLGNLRRESAVRSHTKDGGDPDT